MIEAVAGASPSPTANRVDAWLAGASREGPHYGAEGLRGVRDVLRERLSRDYVLSGVDFKRPRGSDTRKVDLASLRHAQRAFRGQEVVIDLAAVPAVRTPWSLVYENNLPATLNALEAARVAGCRRLIYASSNHVVGKYEEDGRTRRSSRDGTTTRSDANPDDHCGLPDRPDGFYAVGKAFGEGAGRFYAEEFACRSSAFESGASPPLGNPTDVRSFARLLKHDDLVRLIRACLNAPPELKYGSSTVSRRTPGVFCGRRRRSEAIGYEPRDNAEGWR